MVPTEIILILKSWFSILKVLNALCFLKIPHVARFTLFINKFLWIFTNQKPSCRVFLCLKENMLPLCHVISVICFDLLLLWSTCWSVSIYQFRSVQEEVVSYKTTCDSWNLCEFFACIIVEEHWLAWWMQEIRSLLTVFLSFLCCFSWKINY